MTDEENLENSKDVTDIVNQIRVKNNIYFNKDKFIPNTLAGDIIYDNFDTMNFTGINRGFIVINSKDSEIYRYNDGVYLDDGDRFVKAVARQVLGDKATNQRITEVVTAVKQFIGLLVEREQLNNYLTLINLQNGIYDIETGTLLPHDKKYYFTNKMNIIYNKDAQCPAILKFMGEVHNKEDIEIIQELFGYCMYPSYEYHKIFFLIGNGRNGKSTELGIIRSFIGKKNISSATIHDLIESEFNAAQLFGKLANISGDIGLDMVKDTGIIKRLSGGDSIMAQYKFGHPFEFINFAKLIYACNNPPEIKDTSDAMWGRMIHITFPNTFLDNQPGTDPNIIDKLTTEKELSGLFNWAMIGLKRLKVNGKFSYNKTVEENRMAYERKADPIKGFVQDNLEYREGSTVTRSNMSRIYAAWCKDQKIATINDVWFSRKLKDALPGCYSMRTTVSDGNDSGRIHVYMNVVIKNDSYQQSVSTTIGNSPQQQLDFYESLSDRIKNLITCIEMHGEPMTIGELVLEGFDIEFIHKCIDQGIITKNPDETIRVC